MTRNLEHNGWTPDRHGAGGRFVRRPGRWTGFHQARRAEVRITLPAVPENVTIARHVLGALAETLELPPPVVEDLRLALTEACTNVVRHAYDGENGPIEVLARPDGDNLRIIVSDRGRGLSPSSDRLGPGLGLPLIASLVDELDISYTPGRGSTVSMSFRRDRAASSNGRGVHSHSVDTA